MHPRSQPLPDLGRAARDRQFSRRSFSVAALGLGAAVLAACGTDSAGGQAATGAASAGGSGAPWTPVTVSHKFGQTVVSQRPTRVVSVGITEQDYLLALGVVPVGVTDWYGDQPYATWPWARAALGGATPTVLKDSDGRPYAEIAKLRPDLIIGCNAGLTQADYDKLTKIAPTIAQSGKGGDFFDSWQEILRLVGEAVGKPAEATALRDKVKGQFSAAAAANPNFKGKKAIFLQGSPSDGNVIASQAGLSTDFLTDLGFVVPKDIEPFIRKGEQAYIPLERISVLDAADTLVWGTEKDADRAVLEKIPGFANLRAVKAGRSVYTGDILAGAIYFSSPLSLPYVVEHLVPQLASS